MKDLLEETLLSYQDGDIRVRALAEARRKALILKAVAQISSECESRFSRPLREIEAQLRELFGELEEEAAVSDSAALARSTPEELMKTIQEIFEARAKSRGVRGLFDFTLDRLRAAESSDLAGVRKMSALLRGLKVEAKHSIDFRIFGLQLQNRLDELFHDVAEKMRRGVRAAFKGDHSQTVKKSACLRLARRLFEGNPTGLAEVEARLLGDPRPETPLQDFENALLDVVLRAHVKLLAPFARLFARISHQGVADSTELHKALELALADPQWKTPLSAKFEALLSTHQRVTFTQATVLISTIAIADRKTLLSEIRDHSPPPKP